MWPVTRKSIHVNMNQPTRGVTEGRVGPAAPLCRRVIASLARIFGIRVDGSDIVFKAAAPVKGAKQFCVGLLEDPVNHTWWPNLSGLVGRRELLSISGTLFLLRKILPSPPDPRQAEKHARLMERSAAPPPDGYMDFIDSQIDAMFPIGWDRGYASHVFHTSPTASACLTVPRAKGGLRSLFSRFGRDWFEDQCLGETERPLDFPCRFDVVQTAGKQRGVTVSDSYAHILGPLHRTLYDFLSEKEWLLRGEARGKRFRPFVKVKGEVFVSGDYESATDNLSTEVAERILLRVLDRSRTVPHTLRAYALRSLRALISYPGGHVVRQRRGQLMGSYLSFPLLCLQNYLAFRFLVRRPVPVRINGDDIVFRCRRREFEIWAEGVGRLGLTLSAGKTIVDSRFFSLNSAFFEGQTGKAPREIPVLRASQLENRGSIPSGGSFARFCRGFRGDARRIAGALWLECHRREIDATGRSVWELGIPADNAQLHTARLAVRESFFRGSKSVLRLPESPIPSVGSVSGMSGIPEGWVKANVHGVPKRQVRTWGRLFGEACLEKVWQPSPPVSVEELRNLHWAEVQRTGRASQWFAWRGTVKRAARLLGGKPLNLILRPPDPKPSRRAEWVPESEVASFRFPRAGVGWPR